MQQLSPDSKLSPPNYPEILLPKYYMIYRFS